MWRAVRAGFMCARTARGSKIGGRPFKRDVRALNSAHHAALIVATLVAACAPSAQQVLDEVPRAQISAAGKVQAAHVVATCWHRSCVDAVLDRTYQFESMPLTASSRPILTFRSPVPPSRVGYAVTSYPPQPNASPEAAPPVTAASGSLMPSTTQAIPLSLNPGSIYCRFRPYGIRMAMSHMHSLSKSGPNEALQAPPRHSLRMPGCPRSNNSLERP